MSGKPFSLRVSVVGSLVALFAGLSLLSACQTTQGIEPAARPGEYAFVDVAVVPMTTETVLEHQTVVVKAGRIVKIGPAGSVDLDPGVAVIDGNGRYLMPGLADMHVHLWDERELPLYIANGVTFVRNMWGEQTTLAMRERIRSGELVGPTILTAGQLIDGEPRIWGTSARAVTPAEGEALVAKHKAAGYDFIKVYSNLKPDVFDAIGAAAKRQSIPFAGHVPRSVPLAQALRSGMVTIEHMTGYTEASLADGLSIGANRSSPAGLALARRLAAGEIAYDQVFDRAKRQAMAELTRETGVWNAPTLLVLKNGGLTRAEVAAAMRREELQYVSPFMQMGWNQTRRSDADQQAMKVFTERAPVDQVRALRQASALLLAGTDTPNPQIIHGFGIHEELALLEQAGLTRFETLRTTTANPAIFLGTPEAFGTVVEGARADLLLLEANPLADLRNLKRRAGVMLRGRWFPEVELQGMLKEVADYYRTAPDWFGKLDPLPIESGADVLSRMQFISSFAGKPMSSDRMAVVTGSAGGRTIVAQNVAQGRNSGETRYRLELDRNGTLTRYSFDERRQFGRQGSLARDRANYRLLVAGNDGQTVAVAADELVLTGTVADGFILANSLHDATVGRMKTLSVWMLATPRGGPELQRETWRIVREPDADPADGRTQFDIKVSGEDRRAFTLTIDLENAAPFGIEYSDGLFEQKRIDGE